MSIGRKCFLCGKGIIKSKQHRHHPGVAGGRWKQRAPKTPKVFKPNLHYAKIMIGNNLKRVRLCTKCLRRAKEVMKVKKKSVDVESVFPQTPVVTA